MSEIVRWPAVELPRQVELLTQPQGHALTERSESHRRVRQIRLKEPVEFEERLVVERDVIEFGRVNPRFPKTVLDRKFGESVVVLLARKPLFLGRGNDLTISNQTCGAVVIKGGNSQDVHGIARRPSLRTGEAGVSERGKNRRTKISGLKIHAP